MANIEALTLLKIQLVDLIDKTAEEFQKVTQQIANDRQEFETRVTNQTKQEELVRKREEVIREREEKYKEQQLKEYEWVMNNSQKLITLNIGGKLVTTAHGVLLKYPNSMLSAMFSGRHEPCCGMLICILFTGI